MSSYRPDNQLLQKICDAQTETIKIQEEIIENLNAEIETLKQLIKNQDRMIESLISENKKLGGEISKDVE